MAPPVYHSTNFSIDMIYYKKYHFIYFICERISGTHLEGIYRRKSPAMFLSKNILIKHDRKIKVSSFCTHVLYVNHLTGETLSVTSFTIRWYWKNSNRDLVCTLSYRALPIAPYTLRKVLTIVGKTSGKTYFHKITRQ